MRSIEWLCCQLPWVTPDHLKTLHFSISTSLQLVIAKTPNLMYMLHVQVTAYGRQTVPYRDVARSCDPLKFWGL